MPARSEEPTVAEGLPPIKPANLERPNVRPTMLGSAPAGFSMFAPVLPLTASAASKRRENGVEPSSRCERLEGADNLSALPEPAARHIGGTTNLVALPLPES
eukprot:1039123-Alexandrium_andersonii.AAC.1